MSPPDVRPTRLVPRTLAELAAHLGLPLREADLDRPSTPVRGATLDSRRVRPGDVYVALPGMHAHGASFVAQAADAGAVGVVTDPAGRALLAAGTGPGIAATDIPVLVVPDPRAVLGEMSAWVYGDPSRHLDVIGITGTNGKTTTAYLTDAGLRAAGRTTGLIGTIETRIASDSMPSVRTTPEAPDLQALLAVMVERGVDTVVMEVSSHSLELGRVAGIRFAVGAFTNFSQDHLDFHGSLEAYFAAKARLFDGRSRRRVVCVDDDWGPRLATSGAVTVATRGLGAEWVASDVRSRRLGVSFVLTGPGLPATPVTLQLPGSFNAANAAVAVAILAQVGVDPVTAITGMESLAAVPGRMERIEAGQSFLAVVDYAHTPDAVSNLLSSLRRVTDGRLTVVLGCGGDRDPEKRGPMGAAAGSGADRVIVTDDNPRSESPAAIRRAVVAGARGAARRPGTVEEIGDRMAAIAAAVAQAGEGDTVVIAGKGHEQGQDSGGRVRPFDDRVALREAIARRGHIAEAVPRHDAGGAR